MKKIILYPVLFLFSIAARGQNLVPNGSFELYSGCPTYYTQLDCVLFWTNPAQWPGPGGSPDYFNQCAPAQFVGVPANIFGYQHAYNGDAYCGIGLWDMNNLFREYIQVALTSPLSENLCYHFEMHVNLANKYKYSADAIGVYFSNVPITGIPNFLPLPVTPQINITGFVTDTLNWTTLTGTYTALGNESYMIIGNYNDDANTNATIVNNSGIYDQSYIFMDEISLTVCTSVNEYNENTLLNIYPNPVTSQQLQIISSLTHDKGGLFEMFDMNGRKVHALQVPQWNNQTITLPALAQGLYQCVLTTNNSKINKKVSVINK